MFFSDVGAGTIRLLVLFVLPFILIHAGFTHMSGGKVDASHYLKFCVWCLCSILGAIWKGSIALSNTAASALPKEYAHWRPALRLLLRYVTMTAALLTLMTCVACFSRADYPLCGNSMCGL